MYFKIKVHPNSKKNQVIRKAEDTFEIFVRAKPVDGKANDAVLDLLCEYLNIPRSKVRLIRGAMAHNKIIERME